MKYQLLNGWTPHEVFQVWVESGGTRGVPCMYYRVTEGLVNDGQPFDNRTSGEIFKYCIFSKNTHEAFARWLVANTEGDW